MLITLEKHAEKSLLLESLAMQYGREERRYETVKNPVLKEQAWKSLLVLGDMIKVIRDSQIERQRGDTHEWMDSHL